MAEPDKNAAEPFVLERNSADAPVFVPEPDRADLIPDAEVIEPVAEVIEPVAEVIDPVPPPEPDTPLPPPRAAAASEPAPAPRPQPAPRRSGAFLGFVLGGVIAAAAGYGLAKAVPGGWPVAGLSEDLQAQLVAQTAEIAALQQQVADLAARPAPDIDGPVAALRAEIAGLAPAAPIDPAPAIAEARSALEAGLAALDARLSELELRPVAEGAGTGPGGGVSASALAAVTRDLTALRDQVVALQGAGDTQTADITAAATEAETRLAAAAAAADALKAETEAAALAASIRAALGRVQAALESGGPYAAALADLTAAGLPVPSALTDTAESGIPTLPTLQRSFPDAARAALDAALRADMGEGIGGRLTAFLRTQTGARSLEPREGSDPDAILSRAEAALREGQLAAALTELAALPEPAKAALAGWLTMAGQRDAATQAVTALTATMEAG